MQPLGGETGAVLLMRHAGRRYILKISAIPGDLHTSQVFYGALAPASVPAPRVLLQDHARHLVPSKYQLLTFLPGHGGSGAGTEQEKRGLLAGPGAAPHPPPGHAGLGHAGPQRHLVSRILAGSSMKQQYFAILPPAAKATLFPAGRAAQIEQRTFFNRAWPQPRRALIHADIGADNVLYHVGAASVTFAGLLDPGSGTSRAIPCSIWWRGCASGRRSARACGPATPPARR